MNTRVITAGEKLKDIRKRYKIKQYELSGNELTRNMISMIETNKAGLTKNTAEILLKNIYRLCEKKSIPCDVTLEYLLESDEIQAKKICDSFIKLLNSNPSKVFENEFETSLSEIQKLLDTYKLRDKKLTIYLKLSDIYNNSRDFYKAYLYSLRAFENYNDLFNNPELINLIIKLTNYCNRLKKYKEALNFSKLAYIYMPNLPKDKAYKLKFNTIRAYKNLKDYDLALKTIDEIENSFKEKLNSDSTEKISILIFKANCLCEKKFFIDSLQIQKRILELTEDNVELHLVTLCNIIEIYTKINDSQKLKEYIDRSIFYLKEYDKLKNKIYSSEIYNTIGLGYYAINKFETSKLYFNKALSESKKYKDVDIIISSFEKLLSISIKSNCKDEVNYLKNQLIELISLKLLPVNNLLIFEFIRYYNDLGDRETINDIVNFAKSVFSK